MIATFICPYVLFTSRATVSILLHLYTGHDEKSSQLLLVLKLYFIKSRKAYRLLLSASD